jgi:hypothetical protein
MIFAGFSRVNAAANRSDTIICYLNVTGSEATDVTDCVDAHLRNITDTSFANIRLDARDDVVVDLAESSVDYYTVGNVRFLNWTVVFGREYDTEETT